MLNIRLIRENPEKVKKSLLKRMDNVDFFGLLNLDEQKRKLVFETDALKAERNKVSSHIGDLMKEGKPAEDLIIEMQTLSSKIKKLDNKLSEIQNRIDNYLVALPNIPDDDVPPGGKENNEKIKEWGQKTNFTFKPKDHMELAESLDLIDYKCGAKLGGKGFWIYKGYGALMEWGLINYFIEEHLKDRYEFILLPHILNYQCGYVAGQFPKFEDDVYQLEKQPMQGFKHFLLPTSETGLVNLHSDEILKEEELPKKYFSYTPCYRREAGSYRTEERGMIRGHQFNKVEMFQFTTPQQSEGALKELLYKAEKLVKGLGLHYQISKLAAKDCSASMAKTYDIEVWIPSMNQYKEVSSASNARDYQARRGNIRFNPKGSNETQFVHTLNASGLATSRLIPAILEQFQKEDGSVAIPEVLQRWMGINVIL